MGNVPWAHLFPRSIPLQSPQRRRSVGQQRGHPAWSQPWEPSPRPIDGPNHKRLLGEWKRRERWIAAGLRTGSDRLLQFCSIYSDPGRPPFEVPSASRRMSLPSHPLTTVRGLRFSSSLIDFPTNLVTYSGRLSLLNLPPPCQTIL